MKRFFRIYRQLFIANVSKTLAYRMDFYNNIFASFAWGVFSIVAVFLITGNATNVMGWTQAEILLLAITYASIVGIFHLFFSRNFVSAARIIHYGELDSLSLKPIDSLFLLTTSEINLASSIRFLLSFGVIFYINNIYSLNITFWHFLAFCVLGVVGAMVLYWIHVFLVSILLWRSHLSNLIDLGGLFTATARYPIDMLRSAPMGVMVFFFISLMTVNIPTKVLLGKASAHDVLLFLFIATITWVSSRLFWKISLRAYTGASG